MTRRPRPLWFHVLANSSIGLIGGLFLVTSDVNSIMSWLFVSIAGGLVLTPISRRRERKTLAGDALARTLATADLEALGAPRGIVHPAGSGSSTELDRRRHVQ